jgi:hypothetical protein
MFASKDAERLGGHSMRFIRLLSMALALTCAGCTNPPGRDLGNDLTPGVSVADMHHVLRQHGVSQVHYDRDERNPTWHGMFFASDVFDQPAYVTVLFEQDRARLISADIYLRSHASPPFWTVSECRQRFARLIDGLQASFPGTEPEARSTSNLESRSWSADRRYAETRLDIARPGECASITATWFDGTEGELDAFLTQFAKAQPQ